MKRTIDTWTTKDGRVIPIREMDDSHLINTIAYLFKNHEFTRIKINSYLMELSLTVAGRDWKAADKIEDMRMALMQEKRVVVNNTMPALISEALKRSLRLPTMYELNKNNWLTIENWASEYVNASSEIYQSLLEFNDNSGNNV